MQYEIEGTKQLISMIDNDKLCNEARIYSEKIGIPLNLELELPIHVTCSAAANSAANNVVKKTMEDLNTYMQQKVKGEFAIRFEAKNIEIMSMFKALDASQENYLDIETMDYLIDHFECLNVNHSILIEISRAKMDLEMGLPVSEKRSET